MSDLTKTFKQELSEPQTWVSRVVGSAKFSLGYLGQEFRRSLSFGEKERKDFGIPNHLRDRPLIVASLCLGKSSYRGKDNVERLSGTRFEHELLNMQSTDVALIDQGQLYSFFENLGVAVSERNLGRDTNFMTDSQNISQNVEVAEKQENPYTVGVTYFPAMDENGDFLQSETSHKNDAIVSAFFYDKDSANSTYLAFLEVLNKAGYCKSVALENNYEVN